MATLVDQLRAAAAARVARNGGRYWGSSYWWHCPTCTFSCYYESLNPERFEREVQLHKRDGCSSYSVLRRRCDVEGWVPFNGRYIRWLDNLGLPYIQKEVRDGRELKSGGRSWVTRNFGPQWLYVVVELATEIPARYRKQLLFQLHADPDDMAAFSARMKLALNGEVLRTGAHTENNPATEARVKDELARYAKRHGIRWTKPAKREQQNGGFYV